MRISEIPHVEHGRIAICSCQTAFRIDETTVTEEYSLPDLPPPESIGRYHNLRYIGRGASNCVYEGIQAGTDLHAAIKTLLPEYAADKPSRDQFLHAAKIYAKAVHPNIVKVFETGKDANGVPFLAMEFLSGGTLADRMQGNSPFTSREAAEIGVAICHALIVTAELGIVHRDIKPDNIMISADGQYKLTDLGLAKLDPSAASGNDVCVLEENRTDKPIRKSSFGTLEYMSPEQFIDADSCDIRSDIYSLGVTMYQLAAGRLPFAPKSRSELRHMHLSVEPLVPSTFRPDIPLDFDYIVLRCIQKRPDERYQTPSELLADLEAFLAGKPLPSTTGGAVTVVREMGRIGMQPESPRRYSLLPVAAVLLVLLILCLAGVLVLMKRRSAPPPEQNAPARPRESVPDTFGIDAPGDKPAARPAENGKTNAMSESDIQITQDYENAKAAAKQARNDKTGYNEAIKALESFQTSDKIDHMERMSLISKLREESEDAVEKLMETLDEKAAPFIEAGDWNAAIDVYLNDVGALEPESRESREQRVFSLERSRRKAAEAAKNAQTSPDEGTNDPGGVPDEDEPPEMSFDEDGDETPDKSSDEEEGSWEP